MTHDVDELRRDYRAIEAPAHLAGRIVARARDRRAPAHWWPAAVAVTACLMVLVAVPLLREDTPGTQQASVPRTASTTPLARVAAASPPLATPSLNQVRSLPVRSLPPKPRVSPEAEPVKSPDLESHRMEEPAHDYV